MSTHSHSPGSNMNLSYVELQKNQGTLNRSAFVVVQAEEKAQQRRQEKLQTLQSKDNNLLKQKG